MTVALVYAAELPNEGWHAAWDALDSKAKDRAVEVLEEMIVEVSGRIFLCAEMITMHEQQHHRIVPEEVVRLPLFRHQLNLVRELKARRAVVPERCAALFDWLLEQTEQVGQQFMWRLLEET